MSSTTTNPLDVLPDRRSPDTAARSPGTALLRLAIGVALALTVELAFGVLARHQPRAFITSLFFYPVYLSFALWLCLRIERRYGGHASLVLEYILFAAAGLTIEWALLGNSPWSNPNASQLGMVSMWVAWILVPRLLIEREISPKVQRALRWTLLLGLGAMLGGGLFAPPNARFVIVVVLACLTFISMNVFYIAALRHEK